MPDADVVVVGGGVIGSAVAYFLAADRDFDGRVLVVEMDPAYERASTPRSLGGIRQQFSTPENVRMSAFAAAFVREAPERLAVDGQAPDLGFHERGYLFLASDAGVGTIAENHRQQAALGADNVLLSADELGSRFPWLATGDLAAGCLGRSGEGWIDPWALLQALRAKARALGVEYRHGRVTGFARRGARLAAAHLADGARVGARWFVDAAGARARDVAALAGVELPVFPRKRQVFQFECREALPGCPLVVDPSGLYFRPEGTSFLCGIAPDEDDDPDTLDLDTDDTLFERRLWPLLAARVPAFEAIKPSGSWGGHYAVNSFDANAIVGPHPEIDNLLFANGFSGHGLQQSPAVGRALGEWIVHGEYRSLDLSRFAYRRIAAGEPIVERNVV